MRIKTENVRNIKEDWVIVFGGPKLLSGFRDTTKKRREKIPTDAKTGGRILGEKTIEN